jgi:ATP-dependent DNA ligase
MAARLAAKLPEGSEWLYELKLDGYRALLLKDGDAVSILGLRTDTEPKDVRRE